MSNRYQDCFSRLKAENQGAYVPFVMLGDPDLETSYAIIKTLVDNGADALELGIPFSDPIADGPVIQRAAIRALAQDASVARCFDLVAKIRSEYPQVPIGLLLYSNLLVGSGVQDFYQKAQQAGVDSVLVADVPMLESEEFIQAAAKFDIDPVFIAAPNASQANLQEVASKAKGYTYLLSRAGVTGTDVKAEMPVEGIINSLKGFNAPPCLLGFGISSPQQVKQAIIAGADGAISGSAVVKVIQDNLTDTAKMLAELATFTQEMKAATIST